MRLLPGKWRKWSETLLDALLVLKERWAAWLSRPCLAPAMRRRRRASLEVLELEPRWCPNSAPVVG